LLAQSKIKELGAATIKSSNLEKVAEATAKEVRAKDQKQEKPKSQLSRLEAFKKRAMSGLKKIIPPYKKPPGYKELER